MKLFITLYLIILLFTTIITFTPRIKLEIRVVTSALTSILWAIFLIYLLPYI